MSSLAVNWSALGVPNEQPAPPVSSIVTQPAASATGSTPTSSTPWYEALPISLANAAAGIYNITQAPKGTTYVPTSSGPVPVQQQTITSATWLPWLLVGGGVLVVGLFLSRRRR